VNNKILEEMAAKKWIVPLDEIDLRKNYGSFLKLGIVSTTMGYFINRNNEATEITSEEFFGENRVVVPASKWRGAERSFILSVLRKGGQISEKYSRNMVTKKEDLQNPASMLWGDSSTGKGDEAVGISSRSFYDWAYSYNPVADISLNLQHNSLGEDGSILKNEGKVSSSALHNVNYIRPGVQFVRYVTLENASPEMLIMQLMALIGTTRYGARTSVLGDNMKNEVVAIAGSKGERPVSSYSSMEKAWKSKTYDPYGLINDAMNENYKEVLTGEDLRELISLTAEIMSSATEIKSTFEPLQAKIRDQWKEFFEKK
jgi:CRISPR-associated protein Csc2